MSRCGSGDKKKKCQPGIYEYKCPNPSTTKADKHATKHVIIMDELVTEAS